MNLIPKNDKILYEPLTKNNLSNFEFGHLKKTKKSLDNIKAIENQQPEISSSPIKPISQYSTFLDFSNKNLTKSPFYSKFPTENNIKISEIILNFNNLTEIPLELINFPNLKILKIESNNIKIIPSQIITKLSQIQIISFNNNLIEEISDFPYENLQQLHTLNLTNNLIKNIPKTIGNLISLKTLLIANNSFQELPISLLKLLNLKNFGLDWFKYIDNNKDQLIYLQEDLLLFFKLLRSFHNFGAEKVNLLQFLSFYTKEIDLRKRIHFNRTLLHLAAFDGDFGVVKTISENCPDLVNTIDKDQLTPLMIALVEKKKNIADYLINIGADPSISIITNFVFLINFSIFFITFL